MLSKEEEEVETEAAAGCPSAVSQSHTRPISGHHVSARSAAAEWPTHGNN